MLTPEQEQFLADFADKGLAEIRETEARNKEVLAETEIIAARAARKEELEAQAQDLIEQGLSDFETQIAPSIREKR